MILTPVRVGGPSQICPAGLGRPAGNYLVG